jgi:hypothetical protein
MGLVGFIMIVVVLNGVVSFGIVSFVRSAVLAVIGSTIITEMLLAIYVLTLAKDSPDAADGILAANILAMLSTPVVFGTSCGFVFCWNRLRRRNTLGRHDDAA